MELPSEPQLRWILRRSATLLEQGAEPVRGLVQPNAEFFPDRFDGSPPAVAALLARVCEHAGLGDLKVAVGIVAPEGEGEGQGKSSGGCGSGACGTGAGAAAVKLERVTRRKDGGYAVAVAASELRNPVVLTTAFVRAVAFMFMSEAGADDALPPPEREPATDLAAVLLGFGVLVANGSYIYMKSCGGVKVHSATRMPVDEVALALAIFCRLHDVPERTAARHLELTPREVFGEATAWAASNASTLRLLRASPERIQTDAYALSPARSWLARALGVGKPRARSPEDELSELERSFAEGAALAPRSRPTDRGKAEKLAELRALVEESFDGG